MHWVGHCRLGRPRVANSSGQWGLRRGELLSGGDKVYSHVIAFDDAPFARAHRGDVPLAGVVFAGARVQRMGLTTAEAEAIVERFAINGYMPEPVRVAHLVASALTGP